MNIVQIYRTESDWCALVDASEKRLSATSLGDGQRLTLTYDANVFAQQPEEAMVLEDAEAAFAVMANPDVLPLIVDETTTLDEKKTMVRDQVTAASALAGTETELLPVQAALDDVAETLDAMGGSTQ